MTPTAPRSKCPAPGCHELTSGGRCAAHALRRNGSTRASRRLRQQVLLEEPACRLCGAPASEVDHVIPLAFGGLDVRSNAQGLCHACHVSKSAQERQ
ncbi:MAG: HNH endonuclease [Dehalococcoidia bacterium]